MNKETHTYARMLVETALTEVEPTAEALISWLLDDELNEDVVNAIEIVRAEYA